MKKVEIYTDGACSGNPGKGGFASILIYKGVEKIISGSELSTTNNRMELIAVINALKALKEPCEVDLYSDSAYVINAINENWLNDWKNNNWKNSNKKTVKNIELWQDLDELINIHKVNFIKVKGHSDNEYNNRCDKIAVNEYLKLEN
ncbi:MAG: ribonuclease HI [Clostridia bacterium]|nr:ribonuclease HI [Clostridia bacterium]